MSTFKKYQSIENSYNKKHLSNLPAEISENAFAVSEKLDGANVQLLFIKDEPMKIGRRSAFLTENEEFYDIHKVLARYKAQTDLFQSFANTSGHEYRLFGEIYGPSINKRINYGEEKLIKMFDVEVNGKLWSVAGIYNLIQQHSETLLDFFVPQACVSNLLEALSIDVEIVNEKGKPLTEGIVIKPYYDNYYDKRGNRLILKKKAKAFNDIENTPKVHKELDTSVLALNYLFSQFINKNRMIDAFSKHGEITDIKEIGKFIKIIIEDAKIDFLKAYEGRLVELQRPEDERLVYNVGSDIAMLLRGFLEGT